MDSETVEKRLKLAIGLTFFVLCAEAVGGWLANSLALMSDAAHMFTDVFSLTLSWLALRISRRPSSRTKTYGYHRIEIFTALTNGILLFGMALSILFHAIGRLSDPQPVHSATMMAVATLGLLTNLGVIYFLKDPVHSHDHGHAHQHDLNLKSAFYHVIGDTLASVAVIAGGIIIWNTGWYWMDSAIAILVSLVLVWGSKNLISESIHILLEGVPKDISIQEVEKELVALPDIKGIHELHIWCICSNIYALSTHALINDQKVNQAESILENIQLLLADKFNITHSTVQFESTPCGVSQLSCDIKH